MRKTTAGELIKQINDELAKRANNDLRPKGLTLSQIEVILALHASREKCLSVNELQKLLHISQPTTTGLVARLKEKGFVNCENSQADKRIKTIRLTERGKQNHKETKKQIKKTESILLSGLDKNEQKLFILLLQKVRKNLIS